MKKYWITNIAALFLIFFSGLPVALAEKTAPAIINIPGGERGVGFDDVNFASQMGKVLIPGGQTDRLLLINPRTQEIESIGLTEPQRNYNGGHGEGVTSADEGDGFLFTINRTAMTVNVIDPAKKTIVISAPLASSPDYVRYIDETHEVWVTEPGSGRIEIFIFSKDGEIALKHSGFLPVPGGSESLVIDRTRQRAYTHLWQEMTVALNLKTRTVIEKWPNSCSGSRGIALDEKRGFLFAGCVEGKAVVLDLNNHGKILGTLKTGLGIDVIGYNQNLSHLYLAGAQSATLSIISISEKGEPKLVGIKDTVKGSHCVTGDNLDGIWVCDPDHGRILFFKDELIPAL
jgi:hypothetical protein